jgi:subfamily B ATP-binding cassette protein MsbA
MIKLFKLLYPIIRHHRWPFWLSLILTLMVALITVAQVSLLAPIFNTGFDYSRPFTDTVKIVLLVIALSLVNIPVRFLSHYLIRKIVTMVSCELRSHFYSLLFHLPMKFFKQQKKGVLTSTLVNDVQFLAAGAHGLVEFIKEPFIALAMLGYMLFINWKLTTCLLIVAPLLMMIFSITGKAVKKYQIRVQSLQAEMVHNFFESIQGQKIVKAFNAQEYMGKRFEKIQKNGLKQQMKAVMVEETASPSVELILTMVFSVFIFYASSLVKEGSLDGGTLISFIAAVLQFMTPVKKFPRIVLRINQALAAAERLFEWQKISPEKDEFKTLVPPHFQSIEFNNVSFAVPTEEGGKKYLLKNIQLSIQQGERVAIIGPSGAGKSTLLSLLLRLENPSEGDILYDGMPIKNFSLANYRQQFNYLSQDLFLFNDSIANNLNCLNDETKSEDLKKIWSVLEKSECREFIEELPTKLAYEVGERGSKLSGGQAQRLVLARAFYADSPIWVLDEATSALDQLTEQQLMKAIESMGREKTVIAIAHRLNTIKNFDRVYHLKEGVLEQKN